MFVNRMLQALIVYVTKDKEKKIKKIIQYARIEKMFGYRHFECSIERKRYRKENELEKRKTDTQNNKDTSMIIYNI